MDGSIHLFERLPQVETKRVPAQDHALSPIRAKPLVGLIRNGRSHRNENAAASLAAREDVIATAPVRRSELPEILADFAEKRVDCIAIDGGDGTVRDVITCGAGVFGESWPILIVLPNGKTNALAYDLGIPQGWSLDEALAAMRHGRAVRRRPIVVTQRDDPRLQVRGFIMGGGVFNRCIALGQRGHDLGAFNAAVVGLTAGWSVLQALFGARGNVWRRGSKIRVRDAGGREIAHFGGLPADERYLLFASTLEDFPAGLNPFRGVHDTLRLALLDNPGRGLLMRIGAILRGTASEATRRRGAHVVGGEAFDVDIEENFILDGEAFPPGNYRLTAGAKLRFVVP